MDNSNTKEELKQRSLSFLKDLLGIYKDQKSQNPEMLKVIKSSVGKLLAGLVLFIGGFSLFLGAATQSISWIANSFGISLIPSILIGFLVISLLVMGAGALALKAFAKSVKALF